MSTKYTRGALIAYEPEGYPERKRVIPFRFNPERVGRQLSIEQGHDAPGTQGAQGGEGADTGSADASSGTLKHSLTVKLLFDLADRHEASQGIDPDLGIAPEIAAVEDLLHAAHSETQHANEGSEPVQQRPRRPTVLFVWGRKRVFPVRITQMTVNESLYNGELNPVRAEVELSMEVLGDGEARDNEAVRRALEYTDGKRRELARQFLDRTADQGANILPL